MVRFNTNISVLFLLSLIVISYSTYHSDGIQNNEKEPTRYTSHLPIEIINDTAFTSENGVIGGTGSAIDPYIISGWFIDVTGTTGIRIMNTRNHVTIRNCSFTGGSPLEWGIVIREASNTTIENCTFYNLKSCIALGESSNNVITYNTLKKCPYGIQGYKEMNAVITNNIIDTENPINWEFCTGVKFENNIIMNSTNSVSFSNTREVVVINNTFINSSLRIHIPKYEDCIIKDNYVNEQPLIALIDQDNLTLPSNGGQYLLLGCDDIIITDVSIINTSIGIFIYDSNRINVSRSHFKNISLWGIYASNSNNVNIWNNNIQNAENGIFISNTYNNDIKLNNIKNSEFGIRGTSGNGIINTNEIEKCEYGIELEWQSGRIYHNNLIDNIHEATNVYPSCRWNTSEKGNYWTKYTGLDDGSNGRISGDGIGDTDIPYLGLDHYPLMNPVDIILPEIPTIDLPMIIYEEYYNFTWATTHSMDEYKVEISTNESFTNPGISYTGKATFFNTSIDEGEYYLRMRTKIHGLESKWSEIYHFIVDLIPNEPTGFSIVAITNNSIELIWDQYQDIFSFYYNIEMSLSLEGPFTLIETLNGSTDSFIVEELDENTKYFFRMNIIDQFNLTSPYSYILNATTLYDPHAPIVNTSKNVFEIIEDTPAYLPFNLDEIFFDENKDVLKYEIIGNATNISVEVQDNQKIWVIPKVNWNGEGYFAIIATDSFFNTSWNIQITVKGVNDPPSDPSIDLLEDKYESGSSQFVRGNATDPDLEYGDSLTYRWSTLETGTLGEGEMINLSLPAGTFNIVLNITDWEGESVEIIQEMIISEREIVEPPEKNNSTSYTKIIIIVGSIAIVVIIIIIVALILFKKRKETEGETRIDDDFQEDIADTSFEDNLYSQLEVTDQMIEKKNEIISQQEELFGDFSLPEEY